MALVACQSDVIHLASVVSDRALELCDGVDAREQCRRYHQGVQVVPNVCGLVLIGAAVLDWAETVCQLELHTVVSQPRLHLSPGHTCRSLGSILSDVVRSSLVGILSNVTIPVSAPELDYFSS